MTSRILAVMLALALSASAMWPQVEAAAAQSPSAPVDKVFQKWTRRISPGCALSVMKDGRIIYERGYGMADLDHDVPITPGTVFHVASMSKQFTAASIEMLVQQGKLSLDDPVRKYIPELHDFGTPITIRQLIHHISGSRANCSYRQRVVGQRLPICSLRTNDGAQESGPEIWRCAVRPLVV
jgi:CubicO group peptidase (beta-lactamase class C family)